MFKIKHLLIILALFASVGMQAQIVAQWNFNSATPDNITSTGSDIPKIGTGSLMLQGNTAATFAGGNILVDTTVADNSAKNTNTYPTQGTASGTAGIAFWVSTVKLNNVVINYSHRQSNTSSRWSKFQYSIDSGLNWIDWTGAGTDTAGLLRNTTGDSWRNRKFDLTGVSGVSNNRKFAFRIVSVFAPGTSTYVATTSTSTYSTSGTWRFELVTLKNIYTLQILHGSDHEAGVEAVKDAPNYGAVVDILEDQVKNSITLASGDLYIPSPFLSASEDFSLNAPLKKAVGTYFSGSTANITQSIGRADIAIHNILGTRAACIGNHEFDLGTTEFANMIGAAFNGSNTQLRWVGTNFPYLSSNLDFSGDAALRGLFTNAIQADTLFKALPTISNPNQKRSIANATIIYVNGVKIGVVGATTPIVNSISSIGGVKIKGAGAGTNNMTELAKVVQPYIDTLRNVHGVKVVIVMTHLQQIAFEEDLATKLKGASIIIAGGSHTLCADGNDVLRAGDTRTRKYPILTKNADNNPIAILNTAANYRYVGRFVPSFDSSGVLMVSELDSTVNGAYRTDSAGVVSLYGTYAGAYTVNSKASRIKGLTDSIFSVIVRKDGKLFGKTQVFLEGRRDFVRTEETNLGNISADANLAIARLVEPQTKISLKNGGGIRSAVGEVFSVGSSVQLLPPAPNLSANKIRGDISQLDIENSLRFNNRLSLLDITAANTRRILEHAVAASGTGITPGQFPQVSGVRFAFDLTKPAQSRIRSAVLVDTNGKTTDTLVRNFQPWGDTTRIIKFVTLNFLAGGGDGYPFVKFGTKRRDLDTMKALIGTPNRATFQIAGSEQDAFAEYLTARFKTVGYNIKDTGARFDLRIQRIDLSGDRIFGALTAFRLISPTTNTRIITKTSSTSTINIVFSKSVPAIRYRFLLDLPTGNFSNPVLNTLTNNNGKDTVLTFTLGQLDALLASRGLKAGDSTILKWIVRAYDGSDSLNSTQTYNIILKREAGLSAFRLITPVNGTRIETANTLTTPINIRWRASKNAVRYAFRVDLISGNFLTPLFTLPSDNSGKDTTLSTVTPALLDIILVSRGLNPGDSLDVKYTVIAYGANKDSLFSSDVYTIRLVRKIQLVAFNLTSPTSNFRLVTNSKNAAIVSFNWSASTAGSIYYVIMDRATGNFTPARFRSLSNNNGTSTGFSITNQQLDAFAASLGVAVGDSINLKWAVRAKIGSKDSLQSTQANNIKIVRERNNSIAADKALNSSINVYPNPSTSGIFTVDGKLTNGSVITVVDVQGRIVTEIMVVNTNILAIDITTVPAGIYVLQVQTVNGPARVRLIKQ